MNELTRYLDDEEAFYQWIRSVELRVLYSTGAHRRCTALELEIYPQMIWRAITTGQASEEDYGKWLYNYTSYIFTHGSNVVFVRVDGRRVSPERPRALYRMCESEHDIWMIEIARA